jgi:hypothetical protein
MRGLRNGGWFFFQSLGWAALILISGICVFAPLTLAQSPSLVQSPENAAKKIAVPIADQIETAIEDLDEARFVEQQEAIEDLQERIDLAKEFLEQKTDADNFDAWMEWLDFDPLLEAISDEDASVSLMGREATALNYRLTGIAPGLELTTIRNVRVATQRLISSLRFRDADRALDAIEKEMKSAVSVIRKDEDELDADTVAELSGLVRLLKDANQTPDFLQSIRQRFGSPNLVFLVNEPLVRSIVVRNIDQSRPINDCILGTRVMGTGTLTGQISADLQPATDAIKLQIMLTGNFSSRNRGYNGPVQLQTAGQGNVVASRGVYIRPDGVALEPTVTNAQLNNQILSIDTNARFGRRLILRIAKKKSAETKPQADLIAVSKFRSQVGSQFDAQTAEALTFQPLNVMDRIAPYLRRLDVDLPTRQLSSTDQEIVFESTIRNENQLAAQAARPLIRGSYDFAIQVHESMIDNLVTPVLAGRRMTETQLSELVAQSGFEVVKSKPAEPADDPDLIDATGPGKSNKKGSEEDKDDSPFEIDFSRQRPILFEASDDKVRIGIRGTRFAQGKRELKQELEITATYVPSKQSDGTVLLTRSGETKIEFPGSKKRLTISQAALRGTIEKKFQGVFPQTLLTRPLTVPTTAKAKFLAGRSFRACTIEAENRWLSIGLR